MDAFFSEQLDAVEQALDQALPRTAEPDWQNRTFGPLSGAVTPALIQPLLDPCRTLMDLGGKRWRPLLLVLCAELARAAQTAHHGTEHSETALSAKDTYLLTPLVEFCHTASLLHDDIEDSSDMRRGKPAAYLTYGIDTTINAAAWLYFEAPVCINTLPVSAAAKNSYYQLYTEELRRLHLGQAMDIAWHRSPEQYATIDEYTAMVRCKTGTLSSLAARAGILAGGGTSDLAKKAGSIAEEIGIAFQILDDVQNLTTGNPGKMRGDDIVEGKKSLPVLLYTAAHPEEKDTLSSLFTAARKDGISSPAVEQCIALLTSGGAVESAKIHGQQLLEQKSRELAAVCGTPDSAEAHHITGLFTALTSSREAPHA